MATAGKVGFTKPQKPKLSSKIKIKYSFYTKSFTVRSENKFYINKVSFMQEQDISLNQERKTKLLGHTEDLNNKVYT